MQTADTKEGDRLTRLMAGNFEDFSIDEVLNVVALSRQCLRLVVAAGKAATHEVTVKAGQVLSIKGPSGTGEGAFAAMYNGIDSAWTFEVFHVDWQDDYPEPIAALQSLAERAREGLAASSAPSTPRVTPPARPAGLRIVDREDTPPDTSDSLLRASNAAMSSRVSELETKLTELNAALAASQAHAAAQGLDEVRQEMERVGRAQTNLHLTLIIILLVVQTLAIAGLYWRL